MASGRGFGLSSGQVVAITLGFLIASSLVFVFGMWVGKDIAERRLAQEERVIRAPVVRTTPQEDVRDPDITFYEGLPKRTPPVVAAATATPSPSVPPTVEIRSLPLPTATAAGRVQSTPQKTAPRPALTPRDTGDEWADAGWTVQVSATTNANEATASAARLKAKGYDAYTIRAPLRGQTWYRVRVGSFSTRERAKEVERRLKADGMVNAYVTPR